MAENIATCPKCGAELDGPVLLGYHASCVGRMLAELLDPFWDVSFGNDPLPIGWAGELIIPQRWRLGGEALESEQGRRKHDTL